MKRLSIPAACMALWFTGCATTINAGSGTRSSPQPAGAPVRLTPNLGAPAPTTSPDAQEEPQTLRRPISPQPVNPATEGPSLGAPEARRRDGVSRTARLEAPAPKRQSTNYRPGTQFTGTDQRNLTRDPSWSRFYRSTDRKPIETAIVGKGPRHVAVLASVHGDEPQSVGLVEELSRYLHAHPELVRGNSILLVRDPNPDGLEGRSPYNIQGVDLNRNFPSENWKMLRSRRSGERPGSEIETHAIVRILTDFKPQLVLHIKDARSVGIVNYDGGAQPIAERISELSGLQVTQGLGAKTTGSIENFASSRLRSPCVTILVPRETDTPAAWNKHQESLLAAVFNDTNGGAIRTETRKPAPVKQAPIPDSSQPMTDTAQQDPFAEPSMQRSSAPGGEALPGEVSGLLRSSEFPDYSKKSRRPIPERGYVELAPPPADD